MLDVKRSGQAKFIVAALVLAVATSLGVAAFAFNTVQDSRTTPGWSSQCDLPLEQRTGGWVCPMP